MYESWKGLNLWIKKKYFKRLLRYILISLIQRRYLYENKLSEKVSLTIIIKKKQIWDCRRPEITKPNIFQDNQLNVLTSQFMFWVEVGPNINTISASSHFRFYCQSQRISNIYLKEKSCSPVRIFSYCPSITLHFISIVLALYDGLFLFVNHFYRIESDAMAGWFILFGEKNIFFSLSLFLFNNNAADQGSNIYTQLKFSFFFLPYRLLNNKLYIACDSGTNDIRSPMNFWLRNFLEIVTN